MRQNQEIDVVDVHITSTSERVDAFTDFPLLDGQKQYTVEITEFVCPLAGQDPLPDKTNIFDNLLFEIRRKYVAEPAVAAVGAQSSLVTPPAAQTNIAFLPYQLFTNDMVQFRKNSQRPMSTPGDLAYHLQRFFDDILNRYRAGPAIAAANLASVQAVYDNHFGIITAQVLIRVQQQVIIDNEASSEAEIAAATILRDEAVAIIEASVELRDAATALIDGDNENGLQDIVDTTPPVIRGELHGGGLDVNINDLTRFVTGQLQPNGCIKLFFAPIFTKHFFLVMTNYGSRLTGLGQDGFIAFRQDFGGFVSQGLEALTDNNIEGTIIAGGTDETVEYPALYSIERYFDHRIRLEIESQIGLPPTVVWSTDERQKISHVIATFPIQMKSESSVVCNTEGAATQEVYFQSDMLVGDITWRRAEDKITERYLILNSQYFHNVRLEIFIVRKNWVGDEFRYEREKMSFVDGEIWTAKLRFRSLK